MAEVNLDVAMESTSQEILKKVDQVISITPTTYTSVGSNEVLKTIINSPTTITYNGINIPETATISGFSGMVRIVVSMLAGTDSSGNGQCNINIKKNGVIIHTLTTQSRSYVTQTADIAVVSGDILSFSGSHSQIMGYESSINLLTVCGTVSAETDFGYEVI